MCCTYSQLAIASYVLVINSEKMKVCPDITELCKHDYSYVYYVLLFLAQAIATWSKSKENRTVILCIANCLYIQRTYIYTVPLFVPYTRKSFYFCCLKVCKISQKSGWMLTHTCTHTICTYIASFQSIKCTIIVYTCTVAILVMAGTYIQFMHKSTKLIIIKINGHVTLYSPHCTFHLLLL